MDTITKLGETIRFKSTLARVSEYRSKNPHDRYKQEWKIWKETQFRDEQEGIIIGERTYSNGYNTHEQDYGNVYTAKEHFQVLLVVTHIRKKPVVVLKPLSI